MPRYQAVTRSDFINLRWKRFENYSFAASDVIVPLAGQELPEACISLPVAFTRQGDGFVPVAVQGLQPGQNLFVTPDGRWSGPYIPAAYRMHPFTLAKVDDSRVVLFIDIDSGLVGQGYPETFFAENGEPGQALAAVLESLENLQVNRNATIRICAALEAEALIQPWPVIVETVDGPQTINGLYRVDEAKFNALGAAALHRLHQAGAFPIVYCQLLSMRHIQALARLAQAGLNAQGSADANAELRLDFLNSGDTISFA
jgi:hypothetical protein